MITAERKKPMKLDLVRTNCSSFDACSDRLPQHDVERSRLVAVKLEVCLGGDVDSANSLPPRGMVVGQR